MIAAVDAGGTAIKAAAVDRKSLTMSEPISVPSNASGGPAEYLNTIARTIRTLAAGNPTSVEAVGLSIPGFRYRPLGTWCGVPNTPGWPADGLPLEQQLRASLLAQSVPAERDHWSKVVIAHGNDADLAGLGEWAHRTKGMPKAQADNLWLLHITWGTGIGVGHVREGRAQPGWEGGHVPVSSDPDGPVCGCGRRNCLEAFAAVPRLVGMVRQALLAGAPSTVKPADLDDAASAPRVICNAMTERGDNLCRALVAEHAARLGRGIAGLASIAQPDLITIGGGLANAGEPVLRPLIEGFHREDAGFIGRRMRIEKSELGNEAGYIGAAELARQSLPAR
jgi:glucokinase